MLILMGNFIFAFHFVAFWIREVLEKYVDIFEGKYSFHNFDTYWVDKQSLDKNVTI